MSNRTFVEASKWDDAMLSAPHGFYDATLAREFSFTSAEVSATKASILIVGEPGSGKTSYCRWAALRDLRDYRARESSTLPIYVSLHRIDPTKQDVTLKSLVEIRHRVLISREEVAQAIESSNVRIYLDGLDEVVMSARKAVANAVKSGLETAPKTQVVITSRSHVIAPWLTWLPRISLKPLTMQKVRDLAQHWLRDAQQCDSFKRAVDADPSILATLLPTPLLATMVMMTYRTNKCFPRNRSELYESIIELTCGGWDLVKNVRRETRCQGRAQRRVLSRLGYATHANRLIEFDYRLRRQSIRDVAQHTQLNDVDSMIEDILVDGILRRVGLQYAFRHLSFQEYFAACEILLQPNDSLLRSATYKYLTGNDWWRQVIVFYFGLSDTPKQTTEWIGKTFSSLLIFSLLAISLLQPEWRRCDEFRTATV